MSDLFVFTTGNNVGLLRQSCMRVGISLNAYDCPWTTYVDVKLKAGRDFLSRFGRAYRYAMWVDGHDSLILYSESLILTCWQNRYQMMPVFAGEVNCWPDADVADQYPEDRQLFLNAGGFIGKTEDLIDLMRSAIRWSSKAGGDDQRAWTRHYIHDPMSMRIDSGRHLFASMGDGLKEPHAAVLHWNGKVGGREEYWQKMVERDL